MRILAIVTIVAGLLSAQTHAQTPKPPAPSASVKQDPASVPKSAATAMPAATATPPGTATPSAPATPGTAAAQQPPPAEAYNYHADGRRDPFQSLVGTGTPNATSRKGEGAAGLALGELSVRGVMQSRGTLVAMVMGPDNKTYIVHQGDKLLDGKIKTITPQGLVVVQEINDPLSLVKQREVRKLLRSLEDAKE
jgi:Tfp pilus assembly protein PilP